MATTSLNDRLYTPKLHMKHINTIMKTCKETGNDSTLQQTSALPGSFPNPLPDNWRPGLYKKVYKLDMEIQRYLNNLAPGMHIDDLDSLLDLRPNGLVCFDDQWSSLSWSIYYTANTELRKHSTYLLHVDDHGDLGSPFIYKRPEGLCRGLDGYPFCLDQPASVIEAIRMGMIDIGSFILPLACYLPELHIRHLAPPHHQHSEQLLYVAPIVELHPEGTFLQRLGFSKKPSTEVYSTPIEHLVTSDIEEWCCDIPATADILIHIDLDFFNDRYGGGAVLETGRKRYDPPLDDVLASARELRIAISDHGLIDQTRNLTIALSPGFFPSEYWVPVLEELDGLFSEIVV